MSSVEGGLFIIVLLLNSFANDREQHPYGSWLSLQRRHWQRIFQKLIDILVILSILPGELVLKGRGLLYLLVVIIDITSCVFRLLT